MRPPKIVKKNRRSEDRPLQILNCGAVSNLDSLGRKLGAVFVQTPGSHVRRSAVGHADDNVAIPGPSVIAVILAGPRRMVGMRMIPADDFKALGAGRFFRRENVLGGDGKTVARRIVAPIDEWKKRQDLSRRSERIFSAIVLEDSVRIAAQERTAAFVRIRLGSVRANLFPEMCAAPEFCRVRHGYSSAQTRSFRYFDAQTAKTFT